MARNQRKAFLIKVKNQSIVKEYLVKKSKLIVSRFISVIIAIFVTLSSSLIFSASAFAAIGLDNGNLSPCSTSPNCVVSQNGDEEHTIDPISYKGDRAKAKETLLKVLSVVPRTEVIENTENYIHTESTSRLFKFVDDAEFYLPENENVIEVRSASRVGESDLGVNRRRIEQIRFAMKDLGGY